MNLIEITLTSPDHAILDRSAAAVCNVFPEGSHKGAELSVRPREGAQNVRLIRVIEPDDKLVKKLIRLNLPENVRISVNQLQVGKRA